jgi:lipopolysaccharide transport system ATP-binding protein
VNNDMVIKAENISKYYRIGMKQEMPDSFAKALFGFVKSPFKNYHKYRSLYRFDDIGSDTNTNDRADLIRALRGISFEIKKGEVVGIIGRNGAGKSTLLKILSRITSPTSGTAEIHGRISSLLEVGTGFHPELTGRENIYLNATILGMRKKEVDRKFDEIVDFSGVERFIDTPVKRYSSGMQVRLAFSVAAHLEPEILIVDEVLAVGDAEFQKKCLNKMENVGQKGRTVLFVSHNMPAITRLCERTILLSEGAVSQDGPSLEVVSSYLCYGTTTTAEREWPDSSVAPAGKVVRLRAVRVRGEDGAASAIVDIRRPVELEMEYEVKEPGHMLLPYYSLFTEEGVLSFMTVDLDPAWHRRPRPEGHYISRALIPGNLLAEGMVFVASGLVTLNPIRSQFFERDAICFRVIDNFDGDSARGDWVGRFGGVVRPKLQWSTKYVQMHNETYFG